MRAFIAARPWLRVYTLPAYAAELNPVEEVWLTSTRLGQPRRRRRHHSLVVDARRPLRTKAIHMLAS
jgi:hypothetical protein